MKTLLISLLLALSNPISSQSIYNIYSITEYDPCSIFKIDTNIVVLKPIPFEISYLIELEKEQLVSQVVLDRNIDCITLSVFENGEWVSFVMDDRQTFNINKRTKYLLVRYMEDCNKVHLLIE
jgi:hypothetical protein